MSKDFVTLRYTLLRTSLHPQSLYYSHFFRICNNVTIK
nr:MAG TPA: hypothetical protein [Caudoviricetes sp.]